MRKRRYHSLGRSPITSLLELAVYTVLGLAAFVPAVVIIKTSLLYSWENQDYFAVAYKTVLFPLTYWISPWFHGQVWLLGISLFGLYMTNALSALTDVATHPRHGRRSHVCCGSGTALRHRCAIGSQERA